MNQNVDFFRKARPVWERGTERELNIMLRFQLVCLFFIEDGMCETGDCFGTCRSGNPDFERAINAARRRITICRQPGMQHCDLSSHRGPFDAYYDFIVRAAERREEFLCR